jgi:hypothetical protein
LLATLSTEDDEDEWLAQRHLSNDALRRLGQVKRGEPETFKVNIEVTLEQWTTIQAAAQAHMKTADAAGLPISLGQAIARVCSSTGGESAPAPIVKYHCQTCGEATIRRKDVAVPISQASLAAAYCDAKVTDITGEPKPVTRTLPTATRRHVLARAQGRCEAPSCPNPADHVHHDGGWKQGHDHRKLAALCWVHHDAVHDELLHLTCTDGRVAMTTASGVDVAMETGPRPQTPAPDDALLVAATKALGSLKLGAAEATALVKRATRAVVERGETVTLELLLRDALGLVPTRAMRVDP